MKIATNIKTEDWNRIIEGLRDEGWIMTYKYNNFDAGIDYDLIILKKGNQKIEFGWDNWMEGEIKATEEIIEAISQKFDIDFKFGEVSNLNRSVVLLTKSQTLIDKIGLFVENKFRSFWNK